MSKLIVGLNIPRNPNDNDALYNHKVLSSVKVSGEQYLYKMRCISGPIGELAKLFYINLPSEYSEPFTIPDFPVELYSLGNSKTYIRAVLHSFASITERTDAYIFLNVLLNGYKYSISKAYDHMSELEDDIEDDITAHKDEWMYAAYSPAYLMSKRYVPAKDISVEEQQAFDALNHMFYMLAIDNNGEINNETTDYLDAFDLDSVALALGLNDIFKGALDKLIITLKDKYLEEEAAVGLEIKPTRTPSDVATWITESCGYNGYGSYQEPK